MRVEDLDYELPPELVAQTPAPEREAARLMIVPPEGDVRHARVSDLPSLVEPGTLVVVNDTKVIPARILGHKEGSGGRAEVFLVRKVGDATSDDGKVKQTWHAMARASKALREGTRIVKDALVVTFSGRAEDGLFVVELAARDGTPLDEAIEKAGQVPLPPYIKRDVRPEDGERYQTIFARVPGAVAAPTAGLHLTRTLIEQLEGRGATLASCTLHVGLGTFQPVTVDDLDDHPMHAEYFEVSRALATAIAKTRERGGTVLAIGTTAVRALESARDPDRPGHVKPCAGETRLLIQPGYQFGVVDRLLTNFHLPKSTLLALVSAFAGRETVLSAYALAVRERYRFFSYGDAMLLTRKEAS